MANYKIVTLPGDGIGPDIVREAVKVLNKVGDIYGHTFDIEEKLMGGCAIDQAGSSLPQDTIDACLASDAVLLGAVGGPSKDFGPGFHFEYRYNYSERVDVGGRLYYKYGKGTSAFTDIDSPTWGFVDNHIGLKGVADFNMRSGKSVRPYIGVGVGGAVLVTTRTTGDNSSEMFGTFGPRIGLQIWRFRVAIESDIAFNGRYGVLSPETAHSLTLSYTF